MKSLKSANKAMFSIQESKVRRTSARLSTTPLCKRHSETPRTAAGSSKSVSPYVSPNSRNTDKTDLTSQQADAIRTALQEGFQELTLSSGFTVAEDKLRELGKRVEKCVRSVTEVTQSKRDLTIIRLKQKIETLSRLVEKQKTINGKLVTENLDLRTELERKSRVERDYLGLKDAMLKLERTHELTCGKLEQAAKSQQESTRSLCSASQDSDDRVKTLHAHTAKLKLQLSVKATALHKSKENLGEVTATLGSVTQRLMQAEATQQVQAQRIQEYETQMGDLTLQVVALGSQLESEVTLRDQYIAELAAARQECELIQGRECMVREDLIAQLERREKEALGRLRAMELVGFLRPKQVLLS